MLNSHQDTLKNLRLISNIKESEYLSTDNDGCILAIIQNDAISNISSFLCRETWGSNLRALNKLYVKDLPNLIDKLMVSKKKKELVKLEKLLSSSKKGLENLKKTFPQPECQANINCFCEDYLETQLSYIKDSLKEKAYKG